MPTTETSNDVRISRVIRVTLSAEETIATTVNRRPARIVGLYLYFYLDHEKRWRLDQYSSLGLVQQQRLDGTWGRTKNTMLSLGTTEDLAKPYYPTDQPVVTW